MVAGFHVPAIQLDININDPKSDDWERKKGKTMKIMKGILFAVIVFAIFGCEDKKKDTLVQDEVFTVTMNASEGGYKILTCEESDVVGSSSNGELEKTFFLPAEESPGRCYRVVFDFLEGFYTPEYVEENLIIGAPVEVEGEYISSESTELTTVKTNITDGRWTIERTSDGVTVGAGPNVPNEGDEMHSYTLTCNPNSPGLMYKVYFGDVTGCDTPSPYTFSLVCGSPMNFVGTYQCDSQDTDSGT